jgi:very-short-patch-repair endonuclease
MWDCTGDDFGASRGYIVKHCLAAIDRSDVLFAWLELEAYGTVAEIGYARAKGKRIFVAGPGGVPWTPTPAADPAYPGELAPDREVWFARQLADYCIPFDLVSTPLAAVEVMLDHLVPVSAPVTESPIEEMFLTSLLRTAPAAACRVMCQQKIGPYRVDFAFPDCRVVVECDGHDYHEKTKEQARRDKRRDRYLTGEGWRVYRFTGSEIFQNADRCVAEIVSVLPAPPPPPSQESLRERKRNTK